jgi:hypothetical protein
MKESDSKGFFNTKKTEKAMLGNDWARLRRKETVSTHTQYYTTVCMRAVIWSSANVERVQ